MKKILCKLGIHKKICVVEKSLPMKKRYYAYCTICKNYLSLPLTREIKRPKKHTLGWLRKKIHAKLDVLFPGKELSRARYRFLKKHTKITSHMSEMNYDELVSLDKVLNEHLKD